MGTDVVTWYTFGSNGEKGLELFQRDLTRAKANEEEMEYLSEIDFALESFASIAALNAYPHHAAFQAWVTRRY